MIENKIKIDVDHTMVRSQDAVLYTDTAALAAYKEKKKQAKGMKSLIERLNTLETRLSYCEKKLQEHGIT